MCSMRHPPWWTKQDRGRSGLRIDCSQQQRQGEWPKFSPFLAVFICFSFFYTVLLWNALHSVVVLDVPRDERGVSNRSLAFSVWPLEQVSVAPVVTGRRGHRTIPSAANRSLTPLTTDTTGPGRFPEFAVKKVRLQSIHQYHSGRRRLTTLSNSDWSRSVPLRRFDDGLVSYQETDRKQKKRNRGRNPLVSADSLTSAGTTSRSADALDRISARRFQGNEKGNRPQFDRGRC